MSTVPASLLSRFEKQHRNLAKVEIDEMLGLVGNVAAKVAADDAVPRRVVLLVKFLLDISGNVLWGVVHKSRGGCEVQLRVMVSAIGETV